MDFYVECNPGKGCKTLHDPFYPCCPNCLPKTKCPVGCGQDFWNGFNSCPYCYYASWSHEVLDGIHNGDIQPLLKTISDGNCIDILGQKASIDFRGALGETVLYIACLKNIELTRKLLERGADPNLADWGGSVPLANAGSREIFKLLVSYGANLEIFNNYLGEKWDEVLTGVFMDEEFVEIREIARQNQGKNIKG